MRVLIRSTAAHLADRLRCEDPERGDASTWGALAGAASVGAVAMVAMYEDLLTRALDDAMQVIVAALPGA